MSELKNCPFCGGEAHLYTLGVRKGYEVVAECRGCLVHINSITFDTDEEAIDYSTNAWNTRAPRFTAEEREALHCVRYLATVLFDAAEGQDKRQDKRYTQSIATVRKMLED